MIHSDHESRYSEQAITFAEKTKQRQQFRDNPPTCGAILSFHPPIIDNATTGCEFAFNASVVEKIAEKAFGKSPSAIGLKGIIRWASLRDDNIPATVVPEGADCFELILDELISVGNGQVRCHECSKIYPVAEMQLTHQTRGNWGYNNYRCPSKHSLILIKDIHFMRNSQQG